MHQFDRQFNGGRASSCFSQLKDATTRDEYQTTEVLSEYCNAATLKRQVSFKFDLASLPGICRRADCNACINITEEI